MAIFSHIISPKRKTRIGAAELGEDLLAIEVGEKIEIRRPSPVEIFKK
ncbi:MAG: hypothetical protein WA584_19810 [Pyrinomonadaceae bacterium]